MCAGFEDAFKALIRIEQGYTVDAGGPTMYGITQAVARAHGYLGDMRLLPLDTAMAIAKSQYWDLFQCDSYDPKIGFQVFDAAYNGGHPVQWLQSAVGVTVDGKLGPITLKAINGMDTRQVIMLFIAERLEYWCQCAAWPDAGKGWTRRGAAQLRAGAL